MRHGVVLVTVELDAVQLAEISAVAFSHGYDAMQQELRAARRALKSSLRELSTAEADRAALQCQVNKLSQTLQVTHNFKGHNNQWSHQQHVDVRICCSVRSIYIWLCTFGRHATQSVEWLIWWAVHFWFVLLIAHSSYAVALYCSCYYVTSNPMFSTLKPGMPVLSEMPLLPLPVLLGLSLRTQPGRNPS